MQRISCDPSASSPKPTLRHSTGHGSSVARRLVSTPAADLSFSSVQTVQRQCSVANVITKIAASSPRQVGGGAGPRRVELHVFLQQAGPDRRQPLSATVHSQRRRAGGQPAGGVAQLPDHLRQRVVPEPGHLARRHLPQAVHAGAAGGSPASKQPTPSTLVSGHRALNRALLLALLMHARAAF